MSEDSKKEDIPKEKKSSGLKTVGIVSLATLLSRILGLVRDMVFAALFSQRAKDAYVIAFTIPNLLRRLLAEGILSTAFIPVFSEYSDKEKEEKLRMYGSVLTLFVLVLLLVVVLGYIFAPVLVKVFAPGFKGEKYELTLYLTRMLFPFIFLVALTSFWVAILNTRRHFTMPALGPVFLNVGIIACALTLKGAFPASKAVAAMAVGALVGGCLQLFLQMWVLFRQGVLFLPRWQPKHPAIREIGLLMLPTLLGMGVYQVNIMIARALSSMLPAGSVTHLYYSDRLMELPLGVIAVAFATVSLPTLSKKAQNEDWSGFHDTLIFGLRGVLFTCIPAGFALFILREPIITVLFQRGLFHYNDTIACAQIFAPAALGLIFVAALRNITPAFYAMKDTRTPVRIAILSLAVNASCAVVLAFGVPWKSFGISPAIGLTMANVISTLVSGYVSFVYVQKKAGTIPLPRIFEGMVKVLWAGAMMALMLWPFTWLLDWQSLSTLWKCFWLGCAVGFGSLVYFWLTWTMKVPECRQVFEKFAKRLRRR